MPRSISGSLQTRFTWTYNRAAGAMLTTTFTTAFCLLLNAIAPFPALKTFGIFNMFVVLFDYLLVISWYATCVLGLTQAAQAACPPGRNWECSCCCPGPKEMNRSSRRSTAFMRQAVAARFPRGDWEAYVGAEHVG